MISDYNLLGIEKTDDILIIKKAYHQRVKQLHPDTTDNEKLLNNHFLFVQICKAYQRLISNCIKTTTKVSTREPNVNNNKKTYGVLDKNQGLIKHSDPAYVYYKSGINIFTKIHPSEWKKSEKSVIATEIGDDEANQRDAQKKVMDLVALFPKAYYFFSIVTSDYPESVWAQDSLDKMNLIEERMLRYKNIIESFSSWKEFKIRENQRYQNMMKTTKENYEGIHVKIIKEWEKK